jgi:hypothetical protein
MWPQQWLARICLQIELGIHQPEKFWEDVLHGADASLDTHVSSDAHYSPAKGLHEIEFWADDEPASP